MSFKTSKSLVPKSLAPLQTSFCINSSVGESVFNGTIFDSINTSQSCVAFLFYLVVLYLLSVFLTSNMSCIGSVFDDNVSCIVNDDFNNFRPFLNDILMTLDHF